MPQGKTAANQTHTLILMPSGRRDRIQEGISILEAAGAMGVEIESICGGKGTCGKCQVVIEEGSFPKLNLESSPTHLYPPSEEEILQLGQKGLSSRRLSCAARIKGDLLVTIPEESRAQKQLIRKSASQQLVVDVEPSIRQYYIEVEQAQLGRQQSDWSRTRDALTAQWGLSKNLEIDLYALRKLQPALAKVDGKVSVVIWNDQLVLDILAGYQEGIFGLAVDIGSTTVAGYLCDLQSGNLLQTASAMNPQISFGEDLMSRVSYCMSEKNGLAKLNHAIIDTINKLARQAASDAGLRTRQIHELVLVGNTVMTAILLGISPEPLGGAPFNLALQDSIDLPASQLGIKAHPASRVHVLPSQAGHIGSDNVGVLIAEKPYMSHEVILTVDIGTNAEIVLSQGDVIYCASSPTGPAFEGGQISAGMRAAPGAIERVRIDPVTKAPRFQVIGEQCWSDSWKLDPDTPLEEQPKTLAAGICGSGIIEAGAELFRAGMITPEGRFDSALSCSHMQWDDRRLVGAYRVANPSQTSTGKHILITQEDIRNIQLAKAALYAGAKILMAEAGVDKLDRIILAGAFGSYIDPLQALTLGLIPDCDPERIQAVGNAAGDGARLALLNKSLRQEAGQIARQVHYIETAIHPDFQTNFVEAMHLPHRSDTFPHLKEILAKIPSHNNRARKRRYPRTKN